MKKIHFYVFPKVAICFFLFLFSVTGCGKDADMTVEIRTSADGTTEEIKITETSVYVHVAGHVVNPNVYVVPADYRIYQVIEMAGGFLEDADVSMLNLADKVSDGMKIMVYAVGEVPSSSYVQSEAGGLININTATKEQLMTLSGIGESKAMTIIEYRKQNGGFNTIEDIMKIPGIKEETFSKIKEYITV